MNLCDFFSGLDEALQVRFYSRLMHLSQSRGQSMVEALLGVESLGLTGRHSVGWQLGLMESSTGGSATTQRKRERNQCAHHEHLQRNSVCAKCK